MTLLLLALACNAPIDDSGIGEPDHSGIALREDGWLRGDLHMHTEHSDGWDDVATVIALAEYLDSEEFVAFHPEYAGNGLDFIAITDHRMIDAQFDPDYHSEKLVLVGGEEFGSTGHANLFGVHAFVDHDPDHDGVTLSDYQAAVVATHAQGALFSPNHPFLPKIPFPWDIRDHDAIEVWNVGWGLMSPENTEANLLGWEASRGDASPLYWRAMQTTGQGASMQALTWYEAHLSRGLHVALVGGSDRHAVLLPGFPTTWVRADSVDEDGVVQGIADQHTFVSRTPASAQVLLTIAMDGTRWEMGDEVPIPAGGAEVEIAVRVGRADGGRLRVVSGSAVATDEALQTAVLGQVLLEEDVVGDDHQATTTLSVVPGDWLYPVVLEPLYAEGLTPEQEERVHDVAVAAVEAADEDFFRLAQVFVDYIPDPEVLTDAQTCDPEDWDPWMLQCLPADAEGLASYYLPDWLDRAVNVTTVDYEVTDWCMGAVGSAVRFVSE
ncbi:MAG: PHP domain-containing protein [Deltaproteobacteria bacterium]|nr:PHP domain-containing protein [Deltaproteobacteria bacterium]